jgi:hypothetical protein
MGSCASVNVGDYRGDFPNFYLNVISKISGDPERCLYDYQYNNSSDHKDKISECNAQVKTNCFLHAMQSEQKEEENKEAKLQSVHDRMLAFTFTQGKYWVFNGKDNFDEFKWENLKDRAWLVLNDVVKNKQNMISKSNKYKLHNGDIVRFGKVVFKATIVRKNSERDADILECEKYYDIVDKNHLPIRQAEVWQSSKTVAEMSPIKNKLTTKVAQDKLRVDDISPNSWSDNLSSKEDDEPAERTCRICYCQEEDMIVNPLIEPCICSGSVKYIHLSCIKSWINEQLTQDIEPDVKSYCWERIKCELCHTNFKEVVENDGRKFKIFEKEKIDSETHMILESIYPDDIKIYFGLLLKNGESKKSFIIGRSRAWNVKLNLDSISRNHSEITFEKGDFYLKDFGSTFGTLVLLRQPLVFNKRQKNEVAIQSGPTMIEIKYGGAKKLQYTYISKEGNEKKCAIYEEFKHKIPIKMREFIDRNNEILEIIRIDDYKKYSSGKNISPGNLEYERPKYSSSNQIPNMGFMQSQKWIPHNSSTDLKLNSSDSNPLQFPRENGARPGRASFGVADLNDNLLNSDMERNLGDCDNDSSPHSNNSRFKNQMAKIEEEEEEKYDLSSIPNRSRAEDEFLNRLASKDVEDAWNQNFRTDRDQLTIPVNNQD